MSKNLSFDDSARQAIAAGVSKLARAVKSTLGPRGRNAVLDKGWGAPKVTKDGVTVAEDITLDDPEENLGAQLVKQAASKTNQTAGDGTTTATVLAEAIYLEGLKMIAAGADPMALFRGIQKASEAVCAAIAKLAVPVSDKSKKEIAQVATIAGNNDSAIGQVLAEAFLKVGKNGVITVEEGKQANTYVEVVEGMQFDRGFLSPHFVTDVDNQTVDFEDALVLVYEDKISTAKALVPLLEAVSKQSKPLLIIAEDIEGEALATLVVNKLRGVLNVCAVKAPGYGDRRKAMLEDIGILTGGEVLFESLGRQLESLQLNELGTAKRIVINKDTTTIVEGGGKSDEIKARIAQLRREIEVSTSDYDKEKMEERLAKLSGGVAKINVGAATEAEVKQIKARVDDALHATRAAVEEGVLPGGGVALLRASLNVKASEELTADEKAGYDIILRACRAPLTQIAANAGKDGGIVAEKVSEGKGNFGYNALTDTYEDLVKAGVIDPTKVARTTLQNAASVAAMLLTSDAIVADIPKEEPAAPAPNPGMY